MESIIITGAGTGLGKELALLYAQRGYEIILVGRRKEPLQSVQNKSNLLEEKQSLFLLILQIMNKCIKRLKRFVRSIT